jgi:hypothetical protein
VSVLAGSSGFAGRSLTLSAYDANGILLTSSTITLAAALAPVQVTAYGISKVVVSTSAGVFVLDDLTFTTYSASQVLVLLFNDYSVPSPFATAVTNLGLPFQYFDSGQEANFNTAVANANPATTLVIADTVNFAHSFPGLANFVAAGGHAILYYWDIEFLPGLAAAFGADIISSFDTPMPVYDWGNTSLFSGVSTPLSFGEIGLAIDGQQMQPQAGAAAAAGFTASATADQAAIVLGNSGRTILNGFSFDEATVTDDAVKLAMNEIQSVIGSGTTVVTTTNSWNGTDFIQNFGEPDTATYGQVFVAPPQTPILTSFTFYIKNLTSFAKFKFYVMAWNGTHATGPILYQSASNSTAGSVGFQPYTFYTGQLDLTPGSNYVAFVSTSTLQDGGSSSAAVGAPIGDTYPGGNFVYFNNGINFALLTSSAWNFFAGRDLAFVATFESPQSIVFNFETGLQGFTLDNTFGSGGGLWHASIGRGFDSGHSASNSLYYGHNETIAGGGNYDTGAKNGGVAISPSIVLPNAMPLVLTFNYLMSVEAIASYDEAFVEISTNNGASYTAIMTKNVTPGFNNETAGLWIPARVDLSAYAGANALLRFHFDTIDSAFNSTEGWYVDDVAINVIAGIPSLFISRSGSMLTVYWQNIGGWTLQQNNNLGMPANWVDTAGVTTSNGTNYLHLTSSPGNLFFRLRL